MFVKRVLDGVEDRQLRGSELDAHLVDFFDADTVLAGDGAAVGDAQFEDFAAERLGAGKFARLVGIEQDQRMQVTVAGMKDVGAAQAVLLGQPLDAFEHRCQPLFGNRAVHAVVIRRNAAHGGKSRLAPGPEFESFGFITRHPYFGGAARFEHRPHACRFFRHFFRRAVGFAQQDSRRVERVAGVDEGFDGMDRRFVHHFQRCRNEPGSDDLRYRLAGRDDAVEGGQHHLGCFRFGQELYRDLGDHA